MIPELERFVKRINDVKFLQFSSRVLGFSFLKNDGMTVISLRNAYLCVTKDDKREVLKRLPLFWEEIAVLDHNGSQLHIYAYGRDNYKERAMEIAKKIATLIAPMPLPTLGPEKPLVSIQ